MYGHLSTAPSTFLKELLLYTYTKADGADFKREPLGEVSGTKLRRLTINLAKQGPLFQEIKWLSEKHVEHRMETCTVTRAQAIGSAEACFVSRNDPMHDSVPYLRNALPNDTDILHEYFIPRSQFVGFVDGMRKVLTDNKTNLLNASVRIVHQEKNFLTYAPEPAFSLVLYINQTTDDEGNRRMKKATEELIDLTIAHKGRFFLPYQLYYSRDQLQRSYPQINEFFAAKRKYDPGEAVHQHVLSEVFVVAGELSSPSWPRLVRSEPSHDRLALARQRRRVPGTRPGMTRMTSSWPTFGRSQLRDVASAEVRCSRRPALRPAPAARPPHKGGRRSRHRRSARWSHSRWMRARGRWPWRRRPAPAPAGR